MTKSRVTDRLKYSNPKKCPMCDGKIKVTDTKFYEFIGIHRSCVCTECGYKYKTTERLDEEIEIYVDD